MNSITYRITGLIFLLVASTVFILTYVTNHQMTVHFQEYLLAHHMAMSDNFSMGHMNYDSTSLKKMMGPPEEIFLASTHKSLIWMGGAMLMVGLAASYGLARSITVPLRKLNIGVEEIKKGNLGQKVEVKSDDEIGRLAAAFNDMSDALAQNSRLRQRLLADVVHELRTPLTIIQGNLEGMLEGVIENDKEQLHSLYEETVHLNRMIRDLRDLSLAEAGQLTLDKQFTDINQLITRAIHMLKPLADEKKITITQNFVFAPKLYVDSGRMNQVFYNLLTNALRYTPEQGTIAVLGYTFGEKDKEWYVVEIKDNGPGIAAEDLPYVFNHFYRADKSRNRKSGGSGIGLAIVKQLTEIHGGFVRVHSVVGQGSSFYVYLPLEKY